MRSYYEKLSALEIVRLKKEKLRDVLQQFHTAPLTGCMEWLKTTNSTGYGRIILHHHGRRYDLLAHRVAYMYRNDTDIDNLLICHRCDNPRCINPVHLFLGTIQDNNADMFQKKRNKLPDVVGSKNPRAILDEFKVLEIRKLISAGETNTAIAELAGVHHSTVSAIKHRKIWGHLS